MGQLQLEQIDSMGALRAAAPAWDRLWQASAVSLPTVRAELVAQWLECFAPTARWCALVVRDGERLVGALPLAGRREKGIVPVGDLTSNYWSSNGELLLDPAADEDAVADLLAAGLQDLPWSFLWLDLVVIESPRWQALLRALARRDAMVDVHPRYRIGQVAVDGDFEQYRAQRSKNLRRSTHKDWRRLERGGPIEFRWLTDLSPAEVERPLRHVFEVEQLSWNQGAGHSVLDTAGMFEFYLRQARQLAEWGCLRLALLEHGGRPTAAEMGWTAKGVYHSFKVAYDSAFRQYGPGQLLRMSVLRQLHAERTVALADFQGPATEALEAWSTQSYLIGRVVIARRRSTGRLWFAAYRGLGPVTRGVREAIAAASRESPDVGP